MVCVCVRVSHWSLAVCYPLLCYYSYGFVEYTSVDEAQAVFSQIGEITLDGYTLHIDYATSQGEAW